MAEIIILQIDVAQRGRPNVATMGNRAKHGAKITCWEEPGKEKKRSQIKEVDIY